MTLTLSSYRDRSGPFWGHRSTAPRIIQRMQIACRSTGRTAAYETFGDGCDLDCKQQDAFSPCEFRPDEHQRDSTTDLLETHYANWASVDCVWVSRHCCAMVRCGPDRMKGNGASGQHERLVLSTNREGGCLNFETPLSLKTNQFLLFFPFPRLVQPDMIRQPVPCQGFVDDRSSARPHTTLWDWCLHCIAHPRIPS